MTPKVTFIGVGAPLLFSPLYDPGLNPGLDQL